MVRRNLGLDPQVIVVGDPDSEFAREMVRLTREHGVEPVPCHDVYAAVAETAGTSGRRTLILGRMRELSRENGRLFPLAAANAACCCCLLDAGMTAGQGMVFAALKAGAAVVGETQEVRAALQDWLASGKHRPRRADLGDLQEDDLRATEAELSALLGQQAHA